MQTKTKSDGSTLALANGATAYVHSWLPAGKPRAALQIIHGMAEHGGRYARLAQALTVAGFAVYAQDLPGHGRSAASAADLGHMADGDGWAFTLDCIHGVNRHIAGEVQDAPLFVLGHSMGGYLLQHYVADQSRDLQGVIFSGCSGDLGPLRSIGLALIRIEALLGARRRSWLGEQLSFRDFNRRFKPTRTEFDWLSRDVAEVDRYIADPYCGFRCSCETWSELLKACGQLADPARLQMIRKDLPVLLVTGSEDAANGGEKGPRTLEHLYRKASLKNIGIRIYAGARHELLNETCREEFTQDLLEWLQQQL